MIQLNPITTSHPDYGFVENLLHASFPFEERRADERQRYNTDHNEKFECFLIIESETSLPIGLITVWNLNGFKYIEHLATSPKHRNKGYGRIIMEQLEEIFPQALIILEVERPNENISKRRIEFYKRCGFSLCEKDYIQPSYHGDENGLPLYLMFRGTKNLDTDFERIRDEIYQHVYEVSIKR